MNNGLPETQLEAIRYFGDIENCYKFLVRMRWPEGIVCPHCESKEIGKFIDSRKIWNCKGCKKQFSVKVRTIFEDSPLGLDKWLPAIWLIVNSKNGISSLELSRALGVTQKTAWFVGHRIRLALHVGNFQKLAGEIEVDETFIGGKARNMHKGKRKAKGRGVVGKTAVQGLLERHSIRPSRIFLKVIPNTKRKIVQKNVRDYVLKGSHVMTDALRSYRGLNDEYVHNVIDHAEAYVRGNVHTNGLENFWSLLKRGIRGTYVSIEPFHLFRYLDEQAFRFNERALTDSERFVSITSVLSGKRLSYLELTGKVNSLYPTKILQNS
ncbi:MAG TPA: IS1595 family transposase [Verrucomicrobiae bacterium]|nr:IS1595 family transposase [Verrucomicrobiae bacterium]